MFFVISGFLITSVILDDLAAGRFSLLGFYERRVRRIFPALFATLLATLAAGLLILLPDDLKTLGRSATAATLFSSNLLFWSEAGYFDVAAAHKPLLHTWSLSVEEQFYLVFPLALLLLVRSRRDLVRYGAVALPLSLALAAWTARSAPDSAFYLAPMRAWELLLGALLAAGALPPPRHQGVRDGLSLLGLGLIAWSVLAISPETPFPAAAIPASLGAGLVIHAGTGGGSLGGRVLGTPPVAFTGLVSYSLYLWHWPLLVLAGAYAARPLTTAEAALVLLVTLPVAVASWRWVERPFRGERPVLPGRRVFAAAGTAMGVTAALGIALQLGHGLPSRLPPDVALLAAGAHDRNPHRGGCLGPSPEAVLAGQLCPLGAAAPAPPTFLLWGDSHAEMLRDALGEAAAQAARAGLFAGRPGCPPLAGVSVEGPEAVPCRRFDEAVLRLATRGDIGTVILAAHWSLYATGERVGRDTGPGIRILDEPSGRWSPAAGEAAFRRALEATVAALAAAGKKVVVVGPVPEVGLAVPAVLAQAAWRGRDVDIGPTPAGFAARNRIVLSVLADLEARGLARIVRPDAALCAGTRCRVEDGGQSLYADDNHLTLHGAALVGPLLGAALAPVAATAVAR